ncbi:MAG: phosphotransferase family protein [Acidimicrobiia bacterium]
MIDLNFDDDAPRPTTSTRDREDLRRRLEAWLAGSLDHPTVSALDAPTTNGMSSETLLFDATWRDPRGARESGSFAARLRPDPAAMPVFPTYDLEQQYRLIGLVGERSTVPVPRVRWLEPSDDALGSPFFVMDRVEGQVPPDVMPYTFGSWLSEAPLAEQERLQRSSIGVLAGLHALDASPDELRFLEFGAPGGTPLRRHVANQHAYYEWVTGDGVRHPVLERGLRWLEDHWPADEGTSVVSWGDARIGNILYRDFEPVAVLDWEMAGLGPREIDLGWMIFMHRYFDDFVPDELPGMPHFMRFDDAAATYEELSGHTPRDLEWYANYAAIRHGIVMARVIRRAVHFGEMAAPDEPDDLIFHRGTIDAMIAGAYWPRVLGGK